MVVSGSGLGGGSDYRCRWDGCGECGSAWSCGACVVNGTFGEGEGGEQTVTCESPPLAGVEAGASAAAVLLEVSLNSQDYSFGGAQARRLIQMPAHCAMRDAAGLCCVLITHSLRGVGASQRNRA